MIQGTPRDSAIASMKLANNLQTTANKLMSGGKRKIYNGGTNSIVVPQYQMLYEPQGGNESNPNMQIKQNALISTQMAANNVYDKYATIKGGAKRRRGTKKRRKTKRRRGTKKRKM